MFIHSFIVKNISSCTLYILRGIYCILKV